MVYDRVDMAHAGGRPTKYKREIHIAQLEALAAVNKTTLVEIAKGLGVTRSTISLWKDVHPEFSEALKAARDQVDDAVEHSLYERATGITLGSGDDMRILPPDTTAMIFWLKNRRSKEWRDRQEIEHSGSIEPVEDMTPEQRQALIASLLAKRNADGG